MRLLVFGDSITFGQAAEHGGWVQLLGNDVMAGINRGESPRSAAVFNLGIGGDTTRDVIARFGTETKARVGTNDNPAFVFAVGINDTKVKDSTPLSSPEQYRQDLQVLYDMARVYTERIVFVGLTAVDEANPYISGVFTNCRIREFDHVLRVFVEEQQAQYVSLFDVFQDALAGGDKILADGLHPSDAGHRLIYRRVQQCLSELHHI